MPHGGASIDHQKNRVTHYMSSLIPLTIEEASELGRRLYS